MVDIKDTSGKVIFSTPINEGSKRRFMLMKEDYVTFNFSIDNPLYFKLGDGIDNEIGLFELVDLYKPAYNDRTGGYDYELRLDAYYWKWKNKKFFYTPEDGAREASWSLTANLETHANILVKNLTALGYTYRGLVFEPRIDATVVNEARFIDYQNMNLIDALTKMAEVFECEWWVEGNYIKFGRCENANPPIDFTFDVNVAKMSRKDSQSTFATRVYAFGSDRNIPRSYRRELEFTATVEGRLLYDANKPLEDRFFPIESKVTAQPLFSNSEEKYMYSDSAVDRHKLYALDVYLINKVTPQGIYTVDTNKLDIKLASKVKQNNVYVPLNLNIDVLFWINYGHANDTSYLIKSLKNVEVVATGDGWTHLDIQGLFSFTSIPNDTLIQGYFGVNLYNTDGTPLQAGDMKVTAYYSGTSMLYGDMEHYNTPVSCNGVTYQCSYYPFINNKKGVIQLPVGATVANGDKFTIDNIIKSRVPGSYFTASSSEATVEGIVTRRLMLPEDTPYIDAFEGMSKEATIEEIVVFDDVYPQREGVMSNVDKGPKIYIKDDKGNNTEEFYYEYTFKDLGLKNFSASYKLESVDLEISFSLDSKKLIGRKFTVEFVSSNDTGTVFRIKPIQEGARYIPDETLCPENGDKYVLAGYDVDLVSTTLIPEAEVKLKERALKYVEKLKIDPSVYECTLKSTYAYNNGQRRFFEAGERVNLINPAYFENGRQSRIIGYELNLDIPYDSPMYIVGETAPYSRIGALESKVDSLTYKGQTYTNSGTIVGGGASVYLIGTNDNETNPTDRNTFSAAKLVDMFSNYLSKTKPDEATELITFLKGLKSNDLVTLLKGLHVEGGANIDNIHVLETIAAKLVDAVRVSATNADIQQADIQQANVERLQSDEISSDQFLSGAFGYGMKMWMHNGISYAEVDNLHVRREAVFNKLTIAEIKAVGGQILLTVADLICNRVEVLDTAYRCYFDTNEGSIPNTFVKYDQAICEVFNGQGKKYYWRLVIGVGTDYIDLSKTDCDGTGIPAAGDNIIQLGNRNDASRQSAIHMSAYGIDAPFNKHYRGVNSYSLVGKATREESATRSFFTGDLRVVSGSGEVVRVPADRGPFTSGENYYYYDRVSYNGALWLCLVEEGKSTTTEPSANNPIWQKQVREGQDTVYVQVITDKGNIMLNGQTETTLTAVVYRGEENITDQIAPNFFSWERTSANPDGDLIFNESHRGYGKTLIITPSDVIRRTQFDCIVNINF